MNAAIEDLTNNRWEDHTLSLGENFTGPQGQINWWLNQYKDSPEELAELEAWIKNTLRNVEGLKIGDRVMLTGRDWGSAGYPEPGTIVTVDGVGFDGSLTAGEALSVLGPNGEMYKGWEIEIVERADEEYDVFDDPYFEDAYDDEDVYLYEYDDVIQAEVEDVVAHPSHYTSHPSGIETIEITKHESFLRGNVLKYVLRAPYKGRELEDLQKAAQYLQWEIERVENA